MSAETQWFQFNISLCVGKILFFGGLAIKVQWHYSSKEAEEGNDVTVFSAVPIQKTVEFNHLRDED